MFKICLKIFHLNTLKRNMWQVRKFQTRNSIAKNNLLCCDFRGSPRIHMCPPQTFFSSFYAPSPPCFKKENTKKNVLAAFGPKMVLTIRNTEFTRLSMPISLEDSHPEKSHENVCIRGYHAIHFFHSIVFLGRLFGVQDKLY